VDAPREPLAVKLVARAVLLWLIAGALPACAPDYRIGEYVWVEWDGREYPAYIVDAKGKSRFRVHFDGYDVRWDEDVTVDRIKRRVEGPVTPPPPPGKVARAMGLEPQPSGSASAPSSRVVGERVRVRWRGSIYSATIVATEGPGKFLVHYEGYGSEWDEVVSEDRVMSHR
jgi:hypothetical protein